MIRSNAWPNKTIFYHFNLWNVDQTEPTTYNFRQSPQQDSSFKLRWGSLNYEKIIKIKLAPRKGVIVLQISVMVFVFRFFKEWIHLSDLLFYQNTNSYFYLLYQWRSSKPRKLAGNLTFKKWRNSISPFALLLFALILIEVANPKLKHKIEFRRVQWLEFSYNKICFECEWKRVKSKTKTQKNLNTK